MSLDQIPILRWVLVGYAPNAEEKSFLERAQKQTQKEIDVTVAVLDSAESRKFFGARLARRGIQPVWIEIENRSKTACRLNVLGIDPNYYSPFEAAAANHFSSGRRIWAFGLLVLFFLPLLLLLPIRMFNVRRTNRRMDAFFQKHAFRLKPIAAGANSAGFVFTSLDAGNKVVHISLMGHDEMVEFIFSVPIPGLEADYLKREFLDRYPTNELIECDLPALQRHLAEAPATTTNISGMRHGDPVNLVVVGEFQTVQSAFGARWDETESITLATCWKTLRAFLMGSEYRYSPVSPLYLYGRSQDFALQKIRQSINERLHLRLWVTPLRYQTLPVWIGQVSRDIGVRYTLQTWNLTTHRIDPDIDEARDYVLEDLFDAQRLDIAGYVEGVGPCSEQSPRRNLTGDPYFTDGRRAAVLLSPTRTTPKFIAWT
jgi:hypothetical protein